MTRQDFIENSAVAICIEFERFLDERGIMLPKDWKSILPQIEKLIRYEAVLAEREGLISIDRSNEKILVCSRGNGKTNIALETYLKQHYRSVIQESLKMLYEAEE